MALVLKSNAGASLFVTLRSLYPVSGVSYALLIYIQFPNTRPRD
jgi:hypothetical protein